MREIAIGLTEPTTQFISRLAAFRGVTLWEYRVRIDAKASYSQRKSLYDRISDTTGTPPEVLERHDLIKEGGNAKVFQMSFDFNDVWAKSARVCPHCVAHDFECGAGRTAARPYQRLTWMLRTLGRCAIHGSELTVIGPDYDSFTYGDFSNAIARHWKRYSTNISGQEDANGRTPGVDPSDVYFHRRIEQAAASSIRPDHQKDHFGGHTATMLDAMPLPAALLFTEVVGGMDIFGDGYRRIYALDEQRQAAVRAGFEITSRSYDGLRAFLGKHDDLHWKRGRRGHYRSLYGKLQDFLARRSEDNAYQNIIACVAEHAVSAHPLGPEDAFLGSSLPRKLHSIRTAEKRYDVHRATLRTIITSAGLAPDVIDHGSDGKVVVAVDKLEAAIANWRATLPANEAKARFGIDTFTLDDITRRAIPSETETDKRRRKELTKEAYQNFLERLRELPHGKPEIGMRSLFDVTRLVSRNYATLIGLIMGGAIKRVIVDAEPGEEFGFNKIFVDPLEVKNATRTAVPPGITFETAERIIKTTTWTLRSLADAGLIETIVSENPFRRRRQQYISPTALEKFQKTYVSLREYSDGRGQIAIVKAELTALGISPVFAKVGAATFYLRSDLPP